MTSSQHLLLASDSDLMARARSADEQAIGEIYRRYAPQIYRYIYRRLGEHEQAEDVCADVFVRMMEKIGDYEDRGWPITAWLYRIARDRTTDLMRLRTRHPHTSLDVCTAAVDGPDGTVPTRLLHQQLPQLLRELTADQREVVALRFIENLSIQEVAQRTGRSEGAVKSLQHRALQSLSRKIQSPPAA